MDEQQRVWRRGACAPSHGVSPDAFTDSIVVGAGGIGRTIAFLSARLEWALVVLPPEINPPRHPSG
jgi:hypothetical protein